MPRLPGESTPAAQTDRHPNASVGSTSRIPPTSSSDRAEPRQRLRAARLTPCSAQPGRCRTRRPLHATAPPSPPPPWVHEGGCIELPARPCVASRPIAPPRGRQGQTAAGSLGRHQCCVSPLVPRTHVQGQAPEPAAARPDDSLQTIWKYPHDLASYVPPLIRGCCRLNAHLRRIGHDLRSRRNVDAYVVAAAALTFALLTLIGDLAPDNLKWSALLAGVGLLVYRITLPQVEPSTVDAVLRDRTAFETTPLSARLVDAQVVWIFAPSGVNMLSAQHCEVYRRTILARKRGQLRVVVLNPAAKEAIALAVRQLDASVDYPVQQFKPSLATVLQQLLSMSKWRAKGQLEHRLLDYNPGFSLVVIDPHSPGGCAIVEFHGFHNESTAGRMHIELTPDSSPRWFAYWSGQFEHIWSAAQSPRELDLRQPHTLDVASE